MNCKDAYLVLLTNGELTLTTGERRKKVTIRLIDITSGPTRKWTKNNGSSCLIPFNTVIEATCQEKWEYEITQNGWLPKFKVTHIQSGISGEPANNASGALRSAWRAALGAAMPKRTSGPEECGFFSQPFQALIAAAIVFGGTDPLVSDDLVQSLSQQQVYVHIPKSVQLERSHIVATASSNDEDEDKDEDEDEEEDRDARFPKRRRMDGSSKDDSEEEEGRTTINNNGEVPVDSDMYSTLDLTARVECQEHPLGEAFDLPEVCDALKEDELPQVVSPDGIPTLYTWNSFEIFGELSSENESYIL